MIYDNNVYILDLQLTLMISAEHANSSSKLHICHDEEISLTCLYPPITTTVNGERIIDASAPSWSDGKSTLQFGITEGIRIIELTLSRVVILVSITEIYAANNLNFSCYLPLKENPSNKTELRSNFVTVDYIGILCITMCMHVYHI